MFKIQNNPNNPNFFKACLVKSQELDAVEDNSGDVTDHEDHHDADKEGGEVQLPPDVSACDPLVRSAERDIVMYRPGLTIPTLCQGMSSC